MTTKATDWIVGARGVPRTGKTSLTDDELIICDALFSAGAFVRVLERDGFDEMLNVPYRHDVPDDDLPGFLRAMEDRELVVLRTERFGLAVDLTPKGGELWEQERMPNWDAYLYDRSPGGDRPVLTVRAARREMAEAYLRVGHMARLFDVVAGSIEAVPDDGKPLVPWKPGAAVAMTAKLSRGDAGGMDWRLYESQRIWWRTMSELLRSRGLNKNPYLPQPPALWTP